ncbi:MAG: AAA family ATPase [Planctomycetota bacterium]|nr:AAA family ATPase [Planctomycetota bacterium]
MLVRGEPGVGKTQLAEGAAAALQRPLLTTVVDSRTESRDLLYAFDSVRRLAEAQLCAALPKATDAEVRRLRRGIDHRRFLSPGPLWWAFDWDSAQVQARRSRTSCVTTPTDWQVSQGTVLLIDEIDKAETDVPNGLLEALGSRRFTPPNWQTAVELQGEPPLVVITTNEERTLPDPFLRRCIVLNLELPGSFDEEGRNETLRKWLVARAEVHFARSGSSRKVFDKAAELLLKDRHAALREQWTPLPGQAEYLDLVRAVVELDPGRPDDQLQRLESISEYVIRKHRAMAP